jgi:lysozyme
MDESLLKAHIKWAEAAQGPELFPYLDTVGKLTIGYGRNLDDRGITRAEAEQMLHEDMRSAILDASSLPYWHSLSPVRQIVMSDMIYNLGLTKFRKFVRLNRALSIQDYNLAGFEMKDSKWYRQTKRRAKVLVEAMITGIWK